MWQAISRSSEQLGEGEIELRNEVRLIKSMPHGICAMQDDFSSNDERELLPPVLPPKPINWLPSRSKNRHQTAWAFGKQLARP